MRIFVTVTLILLLVGCVAELSEGVTVDAETPDATEQPDDVTKGAPPAPDSGPEALDTTDTSDAPGEPDAAEDVPPAPDPGPETLDTADAPDTPEPDVADPCRDCDDDGNPCNGQKTCDDGICKQLPPLQCDDGNVCNGKETCDADNGCQPGPPPLCNDGNVCNGNESCDPTEGCVIGSPLHCNDGNFCNGIETCDPKKGCVVEPATLNPCTGGDACSGFKFCDPTLPGCQKTPSLVCDDDKPCNGGEVCDGKLGACKIAKLPTGAQCCFSDSDCEDGNLCNGLRSCNEHV